MPEPESILTLVKAVQSSGKYAAIDTGLVKSLVEQEIAKGRSSRDTVKAVRNKLHQIGSAYQEKKIDYAQLNTELLALPHSLSDNTVKAFCLRAMREHASTRERLGFLDEFYPQVLSGLGPIHSLLDLACGLNPLALAWLPLAADVQIQVCDIYHDMTKFLNTFFTHVGVDGKAISCDLTQNVPDQPVQVALLLKTIPCLEQVDKTIGRRLLTTIPAEHLIVSFPVQSLGGRGKGMRQNYDQHFKEIISGLPFEVQRFDFSTELVFRLMRL